MEHTLGGVLWRLGGVLALVLANGFFVAAEFSIVTVRKTRIDQLIAEGHRGARAVRRAISAPDNYIAATQLGITMASLALGWIGEPALASLIQPAFAFLPTTIAETTAHSVSVAIAFAIVTALHIVLGELAPKTIALERAEATALLVVKPTELFMKAFSPFIRLLNGTGQAVVNVLGMRGSGKHAMVHSEEELKMLVTASQEAGVLEEQEEQMLHRVFAFADLTAGQVMIPRTEVVAIPADATRDQIVALVAPGHAHLPVYRGDLDHVIGMLHVTDLLRAMIVPGGEINVAALAREVLTVPETLGADDLLAEMRRRGVREALVIDEYGGTAGLVTFESLMGRIVGDLASGPAARRGSSCCRTARPTSTDWCSSTTSTSASACTSTPRPTRRSAGSCSAPRTPAAVGDTIEVDGRRMRVVALDGIRVATVWLSKPSGADEPAPPRRARRRETDGSNFREATPGLREKDRIPQQSAVRILPCQLVVSLAASLSPGRYDERRHAAQHLLIIRFVPRILEHLAVPDHAILVDDEHGALGDALEADHVLVEHAVVANHLLVVVAQQREIQVLLILKRLQREERVGADAEHLRLGLAQLRPSSRGTCTSPAGRRC